MNNKKRVTLNKKTSSLLLDYQAIMATESETNTVTNEYTRQLVASALSLPSSVKITTKATTPQTDKRIELPTLLKSSLRTPRSASAPCSPTTGLKSVHFNKNNLEDICLFRKAQTPLAISQKNIFWGTDDDEDSSSSSSSSSEDEQAPLKSLVFVNWPTRLSDIIDKKTKNIRIEKNAIRLIDDVIVGKIQVRNIDYHKTVTIRYTFDFWETIDNIGANYNQQDDHKNNTYDVFSFKINVPTNATTMYFAVNYKVGATEYWDNNDGRNYEIQISSKKTSTKKANSQTKEDGLKARYDFGQSIHQAKNNIVLSPTSINMNKNQAVARAKTSVPSIPIPTTPAAIAPAFVTPASAPIPLAAKTMPIPMRRKSSSPTGLSCHSPLASSPTFMDLNSQSYLELVNKYCFYSTSPSRSPMSING